MITGAIILFIGIIIGYLFNPKSDRNPIVAGVDKVVQKITSKKAQVVDMEDPLDKFNT